MYINKFSRKRMGFIAFALAILGSSMNFSHAMNPVTYIQNAAVQTNIQHLIETHKIDVLNAQAEEWENDENKALAVRNAAKKGLYDYLLGKFGTIAPGNIFINIDNQVVAAIGANGTTIVNDPHNAPKILDLDNTILTNIKDQILGNMCCVPLVFKVFESNDGSISCTVEELVEDGKNLVANPQGSNQPGVLRAIGVQKLSNFTEASLNGGKSFEDLKTPILKKSVDSPDIQCMLIPSMLGYPHDPSGEAPTHYKVIGDQNVVCNSNGEILGLDSDDPYAQMGAVSFNANGTIHSVKWKVLSNNNWMAAAAIDMPSLFGLQKYN